MVPVVCGDCRHRMVVSMERLASSADLGCAQCRSTNLDLADEIEATADLNDPPMDVLKDTPAVVERVKCSNCLQTFNHSAADPAAPLPPCPNCGSMATSVAGGTTTHAASIQVSAAVDAKVAQMVTAILATNPGMTRGAAQSLAFRTIERFPRVAGLHQQASNATVPLDPAEIERRRHAPAPDEMEDLPHAIDRLMHNRWHTPA